MMTDDDTRAPVTSVARGRRLGAARRRVPDARPGTARPADRPDPRSRGRRRPASVSASCVSRPRSRRDARRSTPAAWLYRVGRNLAISRARRDAVATRAMPGLVDRGVAASPEDAVDRRASATSCCHDALASLGGRRPPDRRPRRTGLPTRGDRTDDRLLRRGDRGPACAEPADASARIWPSAEMTA